MIVLPNPDDFLKPRLFCRACCLIILFALTFIWAAPAAYAACPVPSVLNKATYDNPNNLASYTMSSYNANFGSADRVLIVSVHAENENAPASVTFNNISLFLAGTASNGDEHTSVYYLPNPPAVTADIVVSYGKEDQNNSSEHLMQYCNGQGWVAMGPAGDGGAGCTSPSVPEGTMLFNTNGNVMQYCEGDSWIGIGK
jgi:hypothetical protein